MSFKELVRTVAAEEGKAQEVNIAQISEITKIVLTQVAIRIHRDPYSTMAFLRTYYNRHMERALENASFPRRER